MSSSSTSTTPISSTGIIVASVCGSIGTVLVGILIVYCCMKGKKLNQDNALPKRRKPTSNEFANAAVLNSSQDQSGADLSFQKLNVLNNAKKQSLSNQQQNQDNRENDHGETRQGLDQEYNREIAIMKKNPADPRPTRNRDQNPY